MPQNPPTVKLTCPDACVQARRLFEAVASPDLLERIASTDLRFGRPLWPRRAFKVPPSLGGLLDYPRPYDRSPERYLEISRTIAARLSAAHSLSLTAEIRAVLTAAGDYLDVGLHLGLLGESPLTFREVGDRVGCTRQYIQQKHAKLERLLAGTFARNRRQYTPVLDRAFDALCAVVGETVVPVTTVERALRERAILADTENVAQIIRFAAFMHLSSRYAIADIDGTTLIGPTERIHASTMPTPTGSSLSIARIPHSNDSPAG